MMRVHAFVLWFNKLSRQQRYGLVGALITLISVTVLLSLWALTPSYAVLFNQLDEQDAEHIVTQLEQANIAFQLSTDGREILIDKPLIAKTRLKIMSSGLNLSGRIGFELFDKNDLGMSEWSQKINYQRALQGELERTIIGLDEIKSARVHLVIPEHRLFAQEMNQPKASITLHVRTQLTRVQVASIQQLVSAAVPHLKLSDVVVVDQNGSTLSTKKEDSTNTPLQAKKTMEAYLSKKVTRLLGTIFKEQDLLVNVDVLLNYDELRRELIKPKAQGLVTHEKEMKHISSSKSEKEPGKQDISMEKSYQIGHEKESFKRAHGTIERLSISVIVPEGTPTHTVQQIERSVKNAVGFNPERGDQISVEALAPRVSSIPPLSGAKPQLIKPINYAPTLYALAFLCCASSIVLVNRRKKRKILRQQLLLELSSWLEQHE